MINIAQQLGPQTLSFWETPGNAQGEGSSQAVWAWACVKYGNDKNLRAYLV